MVIKTEDRYPAGFYDVLKSGLKLRAGYILSSLSRFRDRRTDHSRPAALRRRSTRCAAREQGIDLIYLLSPTSTQERIRMVSEKSRGFIYLVSVAGVTGARNDLPLDMKSFITGFRRVAKQPLCIGFGVSNAEQAQEISGLADGVMVGSKLVQLMKADPSLNRLQSFIQELRKAID